MQHCTKEESTKKKARQKELNNNAIADLYSTVQVCDATESLINI